MKTLLSSRFFSKKSRSVRISILVLSTCFAIILNFQACSQFSKEGQEDSSSKSRATSSQSAGAPDMTITYTPTGKIQLACSDPSKPPAPTTVTKTLRLTRQQYINTLTALLTGVGVTALTSAQVSSILSMASLSALTPETYNRIYITYSRMSADTVPQNEFNTYVIIAEQIANALANEANWSSVGDRFIKAYAGASACSDFSSDTCKNAFINNFGLKALRRPITIPERDQLRTMVLDGNVPISNYYDYYSFLIARILLHPNFLYRLKDDGQIKNGNLSEISQYDLASELSYSLWDNMPDQRLFDLAGQTGQQLISNLESEVDRMISDIKAKPVFWNFYREWLLIDILRPKSEADVTADFRNLLNIDYDKYGNLNLSGKSGLGDGSTADVINGLNADAIATEEFFDFYTRRNNSGTLNDLFSSKRHFVQDSRLAKIYGLENTQVWNGNDSQIQEFEPSQHRDGFLNRVVSLSASTTGVRNIMRGVRIKRHVLCDTISLQNQGEGAVLPKANYSEKELTKQVTEVPGTACVGCHKPTINPFGFSFYNMDMFGRLRKEEIVFKTTYSIDGNVSQIPLVYNADSAQVVEIDQLNPSVPVANGAELSVALGKTEKVKLCASRQYYHYVQSRFSSDLNACEIQTMYDTIRNKPIREAFKAIYLHPNFRLKLLK